VPLFYDKKNGTVALRSTLERISEHAQCTVKDGTAKSPNAMKNIPKRRQTSLD